MAYRIYTRFIESGYRAEESKLETDFNVLKKSSSAETAVHEQKNQKQNANPFRENNNIKGVNESVMSGPFLRHLSTC